MRDCREGERRVARHGGWTCISIAKLECVQRVQRTVHQQPPLAGGGQKGKMMLVLPTARLELAGALQRPSAASTRWRWAKGQPVRVRCSARLHGQLLLYLIVVLDAWNVTRQPLNIAQGYLNVTRRGLSVTQEAHRNSSQSIAATPCARTPSTAPPRPCPPPAGRGGDGRRVVSVCCVCAIPTS
jgi:hypothetical protein